MRQYRYDEGRFILSLPQGDAVAVDTLKYTEGARYDPRRQVWTLPANTRCVRILEGLGATVHPAFVEPTRAYLATLQRPLPVGREPLVFGERTLLPHQQVGLDWLSTKSHALLHDEQGTGKTCHAIAWAHSDRQVLVVAKRVLHPQWAAEVQRMGVRWEAVYPTWNKGEKFRMPGEGWSLVNPEMVHRVPRMKGEYTLILDESSLFKNTKTRRTQAVLDIAAGASKVLCLDGNPMINRPIELWTTYLMLNQRNRAEFWKWAERYTGSFRTPYGWDFTGATFINELAEDMTGFALRREVKDILDLPEMFEQTITVPRNEAVYAELSIYAQLLEKDIREGVSIRSGDGFMHLQNLRVECALSKVPFASDWLQDRVQDGSKVVVFSEFKAPLRILGPDFTERGEGLYAVSITGDESGDARTENIRRFNDDPDCRVLLATYGVGERGLNLQVANTVLILDLPWTPTALAQAKARVRRYGQTKPTEAVTLLSGLPVEQMMLLSLAHKKDITDGLHSLERREFAL